MENKKVTKYKCHWLEYKDHPIAACGCSSKAQLYTSSPTAEEVTCKTCLRRFEKVSNKK